MITINFISDKISKYFYLREAVCKDGSNALKTSPEFSMFTRMLDIFREWYNRVISPVSWFRTVYHNDAVGGSKISQHLKGLAIDVHFPDDELPMSRDRMDEFLNNVKHKWFEICDEFGVKGAVFWYDWGFHIDCRNEDHERRVFKDYRTSATSVIVTYNIVAMHSANKKF